MIARQKLQRDLVFDVGLHKGEDTDYYLRKGFRVVAIEANPELVRECRLRFAQEIANGRLRIIEGAVAEGRGKILFYKNELSIWGTTNDDRAKRNETLGRQNYRTEVDIVDIKSVLHQFGMPYYLKIDIEGADGLVLDALLHFPDSPPFLSIESDMTSFRRVLWEFRLLSNLGYSRFKIVQQGSIPRSSIHTNDLSGRPLTYIFEEDSSGPFGDDLRGRWCTYLQACMKYLYIFFLYRMFGNKGLVFKTSVGRRIYGKLIGKPSWEFPGWYDTHARK
jgi:FkbM family methyltransferase